MKDTPYRHRSIKRIVAWLLIGAVALAICLSVIVCRYAIRITKYSVELTGLCGEARVAVLSDLHGREFGQDNTRLLAKASAQDPDAIFVVGDMINSDATDVEVDKFLLLLGALQTIAPVYFAPGNHEQAYIRNTGNDLLTAVSSTGVTVLNDTYADVQIGDTFLRIGGTLGYGFPFGRSMAAFEASKEYLFLRELENTALPTILLAHLPDSFIFNNAAAYWEHVDLVISGHTHGGVVRLPFIGGLYAPMQGWFPKYDKGCFRLDEDMQMVITSGLAGHERVPRIFNMPEICMLTLTKEA